MSLFFLYPEGKRKALTFSYDDGTVFDRRLVEIFDSTGMKGTFNLNAGKFGTGRRIAGDEVRELYKNHEVACHGFLHETLTKLAPMAALDEVLEDRKALERLTGRIVRGMAYAYGAGNGETERLLERLGIVYSRTVASTQSFGLPENFFAWMPTCHHRNGLDGAGERLLKTNERLALMYVWGHSYEFNDNDNWNVIEDFCRRMAGKPDIWYAANIEVYDYLRALKRIRTSADTHLVHNPNAVAVWAENESGVFEIKPGETVEK